MDKININTPLSFKTSLSFPLQSETHRREVLTGGLWLLVPFIGWLLNMGHRIAFVHNMIHGRNAVPAWTGYSQLLRHGTVTFIGMLYYYIPVYVLGGAYIATRQFWFLPPAIAMFVVATVLIPGYMSHYCVAFDARQIFNVRRSFQHVFESGVAYWHAWAIAISAMLLSFVGLLGLGFGFLFTSVWFWQVAGFSFASVMTRQHQLSLKSEGEQNGSQ